MKKYLFVIDQENGCDYTIHCGTLAKIIEANSLIEAYKEIQEWYSIDYNFRYQEQDIDINVYDITTTHSYSKEQLKNELSEFNEYLRLKEKYEI